MSTPELDSQVTSIDDLADVLQTLRLAKEEQAKWKDVVTAAEGKVKERMGEALYGTVAGRTAVTFKYRDVSRVDTKKLRADMTDDLLRAQGYLNTTTERRFQLED